MRVGVFTGQIGQTEGGGATLRTSLVEALREGSFRHEFVIFDPPPRADHSAARTSLTSRIGALPVIGPVLRQLRRVLWPSTAATAMFEELTLQQCQVDAVWHLSPGANPVDAPYIATVWDLEHRKQPYFPEVSVSGWGWNAREQNYRNLLPRAARILTGTETGKREVVNFYAVNPDNVRVVPHPAANTFRDNAACGVDTINQYSIQKPFIFYPAQFWPHKNHVNLLIALKILNKKSGRPLHLVLTGSDKGNSRHVRAVADRLGVAGQVHFLGFVTEEELTSLYRESVALVYPSFFGPDNLPPLEAFAIGCPVAAARIAGAEEQLGDAAIFFDPARPTDIAGAIQKVRNNSELRAELIRRGRERVAERTPKRYVEQVCDILDEFEAIRRCWGSDYAHR
jgi:glycosyltransferase involved in cell wall biosynthesis